MTPAQPIPVTIVTGFLGAGKTTLLRSLVQRRQTRRLALLINEFGEVTIDGDLIRASSSDEGGQVRIHDFSYGLIAYGDDEHFVPTMLALAARRAQVDHVLIETSGLALPTAVMESLQTPELAAHFILDATLAVVDTPLLLDDRFEQRGSSADADEAVAAMFERQLEYADVVVLNKIDELNEDQLLDAEQRIRSRAPNVRFLELAYKAQLDIRLALGLRLHQPTLQAHQHTYTHVRMPGADASVLADQGRLNGHAHSGLGAHSHGLATHKHFHEQDPGWLSFTLRSQSPQPTDKLKQAIAEAAKSEPILRTKGFVRTLEGKRPQLVQGVRTRVTINLDAADAANENAETDKSELVFIGYHPSRSKVAALLSELTGTHWK
ncbi:MULTISPECIES: GTP-binding protein [unclassified Herbaspirillum]|uniref:CobW family GTP-binding protein n=1 Tax=unclassified Herbaspirillum TaxID=2624150 RepID=UPI000E2E627A|nr:MULTISPECIES: GTP-binding protein [unclassified Herbaspirillum]RFB73279.1 GTP-binding protein [Herbaspirillum sp. 3R-3a1]TFI10912.1 GTP-binding protein [Herbaspirillum sp. 3R11]TFI16820.1 GTP-binding protein [Herbaspirillum sp. 3R-11]TFI26403.1 GTP-binding protein [Herbaspirillum sp. 3C11]TFI26428.1 GTP-binding protein [Herbaspirillum sp. 3C11]